MNKIITSITCILCIALAVFLLPPMTARNAAAEQSTIKPGTPAAQQMQPAPATPSTEAGKAPDMSAEWVQKSPSEARIDDPKNMETYQAHVEPDPAAPTTPSAPADTYTPELPKPAEEKKDESKPSEKQEAAKPAEEKKDAPKPSEERKEEPGTAYFNVTEELRKSGAMLEADPLQAPEQYVGRVKFWSIRYRSDDCEVTGYVAIPSKIDGLDEAEFPEEGMPALVYCRGGNRDFSALTPLELCRQALNGYAAFGSQYRGNMGGTGKEDFGGDDVHDVTNLIDIALEMPFIKGEQVYLVGFSRGGMMAYRACQEAGEKIRACSINSGLADSYIMYDRGPDMARVYQELVGGGPDELPEEFDRRSATRFADQIDVPLLIGQGTADVRVIPKQAYDMADALKAAGKVEGEDYKLVIFDGAQHGLANTTFMREQLQWFEKFPLED